MFLADFETLAELDPAGVAVYAEHFLFVNGAMQRLTGYSRDELLGMHPRDLTADTADDRLALRAKGGDLRWVRVREQLLPEGATLVNWTDITPERCRETRPEPGYGAVLGRSAIEQRLGEELGRASRYLLPFSVLMLLLDALPGAERRNALLAVLRREMRVGDRIGEWRPGQYLVTAPGLPLTEATGFGVKLRRLVEEFEAPKAGRVTASLGVAQYLQGEGLHDLLARAARAMHTARRRGGNRVETR